MTDPVASDPAFDVAEAWESLGRQLAEFRKARGITQEMLADHPAVHYGRSTIANVERGRQPIRRVFWEGCDTALGTGRALTNEYERISRMIGEQRIAAINASSAIASGPGGVVTAERGWPEGLILSPRSASLHTMETTGPAEDFLVTPPGRALSGLAIPAQLHPAVLGDQVMVRVPAGYADNPFMQRPGRGLVVGQVGAPGAATFVLDSRHARRRLRGATVDARLLIPRAYQLDELTFALLWAVAAFDEALLADDTVIAASMRETAGYASMDKSTASRDMAIDAHPASLMWLGSMFCAEHIRRHLPDLTDTPVFWTREQRGEEAASWLLFAHKNDYLRDIAGRTGIAEQLVRAFCIPREAVTGSALGERALLLLAAALMESYGIHTVVTDAPELAATAGFAFDRNRHAITATWLGADGIWYVDTADDRTTLRGYADAAGHATRYSVSAGDTPHRRLHALADYLDVNWSWLVPRCAELADWGSDGIAQPRSRLLSLAGFDQACQFLANAGQSDG